MNNNEVPSDFATATQGDKEFIIYRVEHMTFMTLSYFLSRYKKPQNPLYFSSKVIKYFNFSPGLNILDGVTINIEPEVYYFYLKYINQTKYYKATFTIYES